MRSSKDFRNARSFKTVSQRVLAGSFKLMVNLLVEDWSQVYIWWIWWWTWCLAVVLVGRLVWRDLPRLFGVKRLLVLLVLLVLSVQPQAG